MLFRSHPRGGAGDHRRREGGAVHAHEAVDDRTVEVAVHDRSPDAPVVGDADPTDLHGRGLVLVERLAETWGVSPLPEGGGGKAVWFRLPCH